MNSHGFAPRSGLYFCHNYLIKVNKMSNCVPFFHHYNWYMVSDEMIPGIFAEFRDNGAENLVFAHEWSTRLLKDPGFYQHLMLCVRRAGIRLGAVHAPWGAHFDLNCPDMARRPGLIEDHKTSMAYCAEAGVKTYTMHVGAYHWVFHHTPLSVLRPLALDTLEKLLPTAEKLGMVIAVENSFEPPNSAAEVLGLIEHFKSPHVGCCFDSGHANMMAPFPGKELANYPPNLHEAWWEGFVLTPNSLEMLAPHIVTAHLHDNDGYRDEHNPPGKGRVDWPQLIKDLKACPRLMSLQSESQVASKGYSIKYTVDTYRKIIG